MYSFSNMENIRFKSSLSVLLLFFFILFTSSLAITDSSSSDETVKELETYIVLLKKPESSVFTHSKDLDSWYESFLPDNTFSSDQPRLVHSYRHVTTGFAAKLTAEDVKAMENKDGFVRARPRRMVPLHTTHTHSFLGLSYGSGLWEHSNYGSGIVIGLIDSGIAAHHLSFRGEGMPTPPSKWKGKCDHPTLCNNKIIGLRNFATDSNNTSDEFMHGTHTASTAAGRPIVNASFLGQANGTAIGMAPLAHLAMYKVSARVNEAGESEILAAMDAAIEDGVDVLSLSLGIDWHPFYDDVIALGAYAATQKGILVSCSAGNFGPDGSSLSNEAPWILTVGASTVDRAIKATVVLGNGKELNGESLFQPKYFPSTLLPLVHGGLCLPRSLKNVDVKGKIVLCDEAEFGSISKGQEVKNNGGAAMILRNEDGFITTPSLHVLPASNVDVLSGSFIKTYLKTSSSPTATILFKGTVVGLPYAPQVADFSSRGPSIASPGILKPDIIGPGFRILAAWPISADKSTKKFDMMSGTSVSCPHLSGIAALLKNSHPDWSPAAIKSAIMTTAHVHSLGGKPISDQEFGRAGVFDMGSGHVNQQRANDPGLIYDIQHEDYIPYLCGLDYSDAHVGLIVQRAVNCSVESAIPEAQLNYPSFSIKLGSASQSYTRTVRNVGKLTSAYSLVIHPPPGVDVKVTPGMIYFSGMNQKATYRVTFSRNGNSSERFSEGYLTLVGGGGHTVRSPIAVIFE